MKKINLGNTPFEKKILMVCLVIILLTMIIFIIQKKLKIREPIPPFHIPFADDIANTMQFIINASLKVAADAKQAGLSMMGQAKSAAQTAQIQASAAVKQAETRSRFSMAEIKNQIRTNVSNALAKANHVQSQATAKLNQTRNILIQKKQQAEKATEKIKEKTKTLKTFQFYQKITKKVWPFLSLLFGICSHFKLIGIWFVTNIEVLLSRLFHFKSCFLWYFMEILGFILYLPIEFLVWAFSLQCFEKMCWDGIYTADCSFTNIFGFHIFKYSDSIIQKCYAKQFKPFPSFNYKFDFDKDLTEANFKKMFLSTLEPPSPSEIAKEVKENAKKIFTGAE
jgi:hypothetical protein